MHTFKSGKQTDKKNIVNKLAMCTSYHLYILSNYIDQYTNTYRYTVFFSISTNLSLWLKYMNTYIVCRKKVQKLKK